MPDFVGLAMRTILRGSNPPLPTNKGLQETADPFVLLKYYANLYTISNMSYLNIAVEIFISKSVVKELR